MTQTPNFLEQDPTFGIDFQRLQTDLGVTDEDLALVGQLDLPPDWRVTSGSGIKIGVPRAVLGFLRPGEVWNVTGEASPSGVDEQPLGIVTALGALNRLDSQAAADGARGMTNVARCSIENGLFKIGQEHGTVIFPRDGGRRVVLRRADADLDNIWDELSQYEDRTVVALHVPGFQTILDISPSTEAVPFPREAVLAAYNAPGGFAQNTVGSMLVKLGPVQDKQNPHLELTANREGGPLPRQDQMARVLVRALLQLANTPIK